MIIPSEYINYPSRDILLTRRTPGLASFLEFINRSYLAYFSLVYAMAFLYN
jgi:hypothetical protein